MKYLFWAALILLLDVCVSQDISQEFIVAIEPSGETILRVGQDLTVLCKVGIPIQICRVEIPSLSGMFLAPGQPAQDGIRYFGESFDAGECGVHIANVTENYDGILKCALVPRGKSFESIALTRVVVALPPSKPELIISRPTGRSEQYEIRESVTISCISKGGRPAANVSISLFLDEELIGNEKQPAISDSKVDDNSLVVNKTVSRVLKWTDNGKTLRCVVDHIALDQSLETMQQLKVYFAPQPLPSIEHSEYVIIGQPGVVNLTVRANPRPEFVWYIDQEKIKEGQRDRSNRIGTSTAVELTEGLWSVTMNIDSVQKSDIEKKFNLEARNSFGKSKYKIVFSTQMDHASGLIGRTCYLENDCATMDKNAYCNTTRMQCACNNGFVASVDNQRCLVGIGAECQTDIECLNGMEEGHTPMVCLVTQCACAEGFESVEGKCQSVKQPEDSSGGIRCEVIGVSALAIACFVLLPSIL